MAPDVPTASELICECKLDIKQPLHEDPAGPTKKQDDHPGQNKKQLHDEAIRKGDVQRLHQLIAENPDILDADDKKQIADTALHMAARHGNAIFTVEVAILKPCLQKKLNPSGLTPLHVALKAKKWKTAQALTALDAELIRVKGSGGKTALHVAAEIAPPDLLAEFLYLSPLSFEDITSRWETAVHRALKKRNFENFQVLFRWMVITRKEYVLEWKDFKGNTALHLAAAKRWTEVAKIVIKYVPRETKNLKGKTAEQVLLDQRPWPPEAVSGDKEATLRILTEFKWHNLVFEMQNSLKGHFVKHTILENLKKKTNLEWLLRNLGFPKVNTEEGRQSRDVVLLVATLIATATYTAVFTPPGGYWQDDSPAPSPASTTIHDSSAPTPEAAHSAGQLIMSGRTLFSFTATNSLAFCFAVAAMVLNVVQLKQAVLLTIAIYVVLFNFMTNILLSISMGKNKKSFFDSPWHYYPECILPTILLGISLLYAFVGSYVAVNNKYQNVMDSCDRRSIPVFDGRVHSDDHDHGDDDEDDDDDDVHELRSLKMGR